MFPGGRCRGVQDCKLTRADLACACVHICMLSPFSRVLLFGTYDHSPPGSSIHGTLQARTLEWVAVSSSRGSPQPGDQTCVSCISRVGSRVPTDATWEAQPQLVYLVNMLCGLSPVLSPLEPNTPAFIPNRTLTTRWATVSPLTSAASFPH